MQNNTPPPQRVGVTSIVGTPYSTTNSGGASRQQSPSDSVSTLSVTTNAASSAGVSSAHRSIFGNTSRTSTTNTTTSETSQRSQEEVIEDSDEENIYDYPDDNSSGSISPDFAAFADSTEQVFGNRFLFAKQYNDGSEQQDSVDQNRLEQKHRLILQQGLDENVKIKEIPENWTAPVVDAAAGEPEFEMVDNPGDWDRFVFQPKFSGSNKQNNKKYLYHALPSGAQVVPADGDGRRIVNGWEFHYKGCESIGDGTARSSAHAESMFPDCRKGMLDADVLKKLGLNAKRMKKMDMLFFLQLLLPIGDTSKSGVEDDPRMSFFSEVEKHTQFYSTQFGIGGSYGHHQELVKLPELVRYFGVLLRDGVKGESDGATHRRWDVSSSAYDLDIYNSMKLSRFKQIKKVIKLNNNMNAVDRGHPLYDPAYKFKKIFDVIVHNTNAVTKTADMDLCGDESTWGFMGYGEANSGLVSGIIGKPGVSRGGQFVIVTDAYSFRPRVIIHRHKCHSRPPGFSQEGPNEVRMVANKLLTLVGDGKIFPTHPHMTWDNYFSGDTIMDYLGKQGFGATMTCRRDRFPAGVPKKFFQHEKSVAHQTGKVARFEQPITVVKSFPASGDDKAYTRVHVSMQSTGSTNFSTVNAINSCQLYVVEKKRGFGSELRRWGIEMNESRHLYLKTYGTVDTIDALIKKCHIGYRCRKYWHSAMLHGFALAVVVAYDIYCEVASGLLCPEWKVENRLDFHQFRDRLSGQMLRYNPTNRLYPGDEKMRVATQQPKKKRKRNDYPKKGRLSPTNVSTGGMFCVPKTEYTEALESGRLCTNIFDLSKHLRSFAGSSSKGSKSGRLCYWCGKPTYTKCAICGVPLHNFPVRGDAENINKDCSLRYHDPKQFGLGWMDSKTLDSRKGLSSWSQPSNNAVKANTEHIEGSVMSELL